MAREIPQPASAKGQIYKLLNTPDTCPRCNTGIEPIVRGDAAIWKKDNNHQLDVAMECPKCLRLFIGIYEFSSSGTFSWNHSAPQSPQRREFRKIVSLSPLFVKIYNEAKAAEAHSLSEIAGVGYRKALEFLIKDFAIHQHPESADAIRTKFLGTVIKDFFEEGRIKGAAKRTAWLGNDETHYLTINGIEEALDYEEYVASMPD